MKVGDTIRIAAFAQRMLGCTIFVSMVAPSLAVPAEPRAAPVFNEAHALLYVSSPKSNEVVVYDASEFNTPVVMRITALVSSPHGIAVDSRGQLYVANEAANTVTVYRPGKDVPYHRLRVEHPVSVAVADDRLFVATRAPASIQVFDKSTTPVLVYSGKEIVEPRSIALRDGVIFFADERTGLFEIPPGRAIPEPLGLATGPGPAGLVFGEGRNELWVSTAEAPYNVLAFTAFRAVPTVTTMPSPAEFLAIGTFGISSLLVFAPHPGTNTVVVLTATNHAVNSTFNVPAADVLGIAFKPAGV